ncbi:MAG TPA: bifunctional transaldolase/phosoglucose isomerase [Gemmatimonadaceae bacterium]|nr:bifunctional transaldolase/phosoglucose isomerase [Gemmatimonadaceae bacterium]
MTTAPTGTGTRMQALHELGQSVWLDYLRRGMITSGELQALIDDGLRGMTSNPTIFEHAIAGSNDYDDALRRIPPDRPARQVFEKIAVEDVRAACDLFRPVYDESDGADGFVSIEVSPGVARDTNGSIEEARRLWHAVDRPNVMIKIPGTREGWPAIERCLWEGININITLLFSVEHHRQVAEAYLRALELRIKEEKPIHHLASVASFFVSRVDTEIEKRLAKRPDALAELGGRVGIANARMAYALFQEMTASARWRELAAKGARVQRPLWASTSTKNPAYSDVLYVDSLIGADTVNTLTLETLRAFEEHGRLAPALDAPLDDAKAIMRRVAELGIDFDDVTATLENEGIAKFEKSFDSLLHVIDSKRRTLGGDGAPPLPPSVSRAALGPLDAPVHKRLEQLASDHIVKRIWSHDPRVWSDDPNAPEIRDRLGWLMVGEKMAQQVDALSTFADDVRASYERVVLCGMGGSSLAPEVLWQTFGKRDGFPSLVVLDTTDPRSIVAVDDDRLARTLFIISSKSGTTQETTSLFRHFWERTGGRGEQFVAITDPGTPLEELARTHGFRRLFSNPADIGGRYSALSYFGLVPAALIGVDVKALLHCAHRLAESCAAFVAPGENPGAWLGAVLGEGVRAGRDKATFVLSPGIASFGLWVEQLLAESTGKEGTGVVPIAGEPLGAPEVYGNDRLFIAMMLEGESDPAVAKKLGALERAGHPVVRLTLSDRADLGAEFFRWEFATAVAGSVLGINAFDQPNVAESKSNTKRVLQEGARATPPSTRADAEKFFANVPAGHYVAIMAYVPPSSGTDAQLERVRVAIRDRLRVATTVGYGPRFLHSTGQLHKGGAPIGHFVQVVDPVAAAKDIPIPGESFTFGTLESAQAEGDLQALVSRKRPVLRAPGIAALEEWVRAIAAG